MYGQCEMKMVYEIPTLCLGGYVCVRVGARM
jgi:hypothetical protein